MIVGIGAPSVGSPSSATPFLRLYLILYNKREKIANVLRLYTDFAVKIFAARGLAARRPTAVIFSQDR
jgi:hypothetical protein